jgi:hypothetical protein
MSWYLLVPPLGDHGPNLTAPLYEWFHEDPLKQRPEAYVTSAECEARKAKKLKDSIVAERKDVPYLHDARCVKSDDPRLIDPYEKSFGRVIEVPIRPTTSPRFYR